LIEFIRVAASIESLNSSLAQSPGELWFARLGQNSRFKGIPFFAKTFKWVSCS